MREKPYIIARNDISGIAGNNVWFLSCAAKLFLYF